jgi:hypothetical protein
MSSGKIISWEWLFEGGNPNTSNEQNPTILYDTPGIYDVCLTVSDGIENSTKVHTNIITVNPLPGLPPTPGGPAQVCEDEESSTYYITGLPGIISFEWLLEPAAAGSVSGNTLIAHILWENGFLGEATLKVAGENNCGPGNYSNPITITRYIPEVTLDPFELVCEDWPAFELSGGSPSGGEYTGPGIENGWFDPAIAGIGTHTITYSYSDPEDCYNFATETILVDACTGIQKNTVYSDILIYPNPGKGIFTIRLNRSVGEIGFELFNSFNQQVLKETNITLIKDSNYMLDLNHLPSGIYYLHLTGNDMDVISKMVIQN